jgi:hypothetical protein
MKTHQPRFPGLRSALRLKRVPVEIAGELQCDPTGKANAILREAFSIFDGFAAASSVGLAFVDRTFRITSINSVLASMSVGAVEGQAGRLMNEVVPGLWPQLEPLCLHVVERNEPVTNIEITGEVPGEPIGRTTGGPASTR